MVQRMAADQRRADVALGQLLDSAYLLMGLSYSEELVAQVLEGVMNIQESTTYQAILREGRQEGLVEGRVPGEQQLLIRLGTKRFGNPDAATLAAIEAIRDFERLEALGERILDPDVRDWAACSAAP